MHMLYNSDSYVIVQFEVPAEAEAGSENRDHRLTRGGYEIVDKFARKEIFIEGAMAASFREGVDALNEGSPTEDDFDDYIGRYAALMQQPVILH